jgi:hypothetical protein
MIETTLKNIEKIGKDCIRDNASTVLFFGQESLELQKDKIRNDYIESVCFFLHHAFMRGRKDTVSDIYYYHTRKVLENFIRTNSFLFLKETITQYDYLKEINAFKKKNGLETYQNVAGKVHYDSFLSFSKKLKDSGYPLLYDFITPLNDKESRFVNNDRDLSMIFSVLKYSFTLSDTDNNIVEHSINSIKASRIIELYEEIDNISFVGDKIVTFFLRNILLIYFEQNKYNSLAINELKCFLPFDTWISRTCIKIGIGTETDNLQILKEKMISTCKNFSINPLYFNQGAWYIGANSYTVLLSILGKSLI